MREKFAAFSGIVRAGFMHTEKKERNAMKRFCEEDIASGFECPRCGNHVCRRCAAAWGGLCPNCTGRLYRIS